MRASAPPPSQIASDQSQRADSVPNNSGADAVPTLTPAQKRLRNAMLIDRFSRGFFPFLFCLLNCIYWVLFYEYL